MAFGGGHKAFTTEDTEITEEKRRASFEFVRKIGTAREGRAQSLMPKA